MRSQLQMMAASLCMVQTKSELPTFTVHADKCTKLLHRQEKAK